MEKKKTKQNKKIKLSVFKHCVQYTSLTLTLEGRDWIEDAVSQRGGV